MYHFLTNPPPFIFFTGKGGVGKTSLACASAVALCDAGKRVLLVSTDPASNVGQVFATEIGNRITAIAAVPGLSALEIDPPRSGQSLSGADCRPGARQVARERGAQHRGAALRRLYHRDRRL